MSIHRTGPSLLQVRQSLRKPFSNFDFVEDKFGDYPAIRRLFSLSRSYGGRSLIVEDIEPMGVIADENQEISEYFRDYRCEGVKRISFWKSNRFARRRSADLLGYAILKKDVVHSKNYNQWHVFESVFVKYPDSHNCVAGLKRFFVSVGRSRYHIDGILYCQQNGLNKACAQVALRSVCSIHIPDQELSYRRINELAAKGEPVVTPGKGLSVLQIRAVLDGLGLRFHDLEYEQEPEARQDQPYQKFLYAGVESGNGALLGFQLTGPEAEKDQYHIIPFYGHTFNQDTWAPNAEVAYFKIGSHTRYLPSETWLSSFIGHDDNFGSNFCVPRLYVTPEQANYVIEIFGRNVLYSGVAAEAVGVQYLYSLLAKILPSESSWMRRLFKYVKSQQVVLRAVSMDRRQYVAHLKKMRGWKNTKEFFRTRSLFSLLASEMPEHLWVIEISIPELFPANQRKLGEIVLDATKELSDELDFSLFLFARFPGKYMFFEKMDHGKPEFFSLPSRITTHTELYHFCK
jgi:hypothetical protein